VITGAADNPPLLAVVTGHLTPYRIHLQRRLATELREVRLATLVTKARSTMWRAPEISEIGTVLLDDTDVDWVERPWIPFLRHEYRVARKLAEWMDQHQPAAVITAGYDEIPVRRAISWCRGHKAPVFLTADSNSRSPQIGRGGALKRTAKAAILPHLLRRFTGIMPCGQRGREYFTSFGAKPGAMFDVPLEPDYGLIESVTNAEIEGVLAKHRLNPRRRRLLSCNRLIDLKRVDVAIDGFVRVARDRPEWDLVIVGDGPLRSELEARVPAELRGRVLFLGQVTDACEVATLERACDVLVLTSRYEAWGLVVNEAACAGLGIVASDVVGSIPELVIEGVNGRTFPAPPAGGPIDLSERLLDVTDPAKIDAFKAASRKVLAEWRAKSDPVEGVRRALRWASVIK